MRILLDENIPTRIYWWLTTQGHEVTTAREVGLAGCSDYVLYRYVESQDCVLITLDLDFSDPMRFPITSPRIVLRPGVIDPELIEMSLRDVFRQGFPHRGELYVVQPEGIARYTGEP
ncbi:DUF5615 family PIN-like protein [Meiothermus granaticius]|uniref:DUF5615 domain-containing protein n=1 Tax=Meiothermus granaticius NBRC 107808 TaxID=1227551 RepID=A0A399FD60_9DEIN|nr:DUF5615 family PIN-like protein [Meiothermus granaticius]MCL6525618.1 DUF5615 family PIN-like protein [Thermaceae bacterium]RIH93726.1 hypothetical protein Mgrana_00309 [Meiothermus granaticius NBRC 107808]GEM85751.1 hypothetical protein MGR01S_03760 [Meiothermus granaticius NBRC 107808]